MRKRKFIPALILAIILITFCDSALEALPKAPCHRDRAKEEAACAHCGRASVREKPGRCRGRVPIGERSPSYSDGLVIFPTLRDSERVKVGRRSGCCTAVKWTVTK